jgi:hypothetical protein
MKYSILSYLPVAKELNKFRRELRSKICIGAIVATMLSGCHAYDPDARITEMIAQSKTSHKTVSALIPVATAAGHAWAIACVSLIASSIDESHSTLATAEPPTEKRVRNAKKNLHGWGVNDEQAFFEVLNWVDKSGTSSEWNLVEVAANKPDDGVKKTVEQIDPALPHHLRLYLKCKDKVGKRSLLAFDYIRKIEMCRWAYMCGWLDEQEAWNLIMPAAKKLQQNYTSWKDLGENYLIGREFNAEEYTNDMTEDPLSDNDDEYVDNLHRLLTEPLSPWLILKWNTPVEAPGDPVKIIPGGQSI